MLWLSNVKMSVANLTHGLVGTSWPKPGPICFESLWFAAEYLRQMAQVVTSSFSWLFNLANTLWLLLYLGTYVVLNGHDVAVVEFLADHSLVWWSFAFYSSPHPLLWSHPWMSNKDVVLVVILQCFVATHLDGAFRMPGYHLWQWTVSACWFLSCILLGMCSDLIHLQDRKFDGILHYWCSGQTVSDEVGLIFDVLNCHVIWYGR